jgi:hypothetical protein
METERAEYEGEREDRYEHIREQAETLVNRWRACSHDIEPEAVLEAGLAATLQFLRAFAKHGERRLVMQAIARFAAEARPLTDPLTEVDSGG